MHRCRSARCGRIDLRIVGTESPQACSLLDTSAWQRCSGTPAFADSNSCLAGSSRRQMSTACPLSTPSIMVTPSMLTRSIRCLSKAHRVCHASGPGHPKLLSLPRCASPRPVIRGPDRLFLLPPAPPPPHLPAIPLLHLLPLPPRLHPLTPFFPHFVPLKESVLRGLGIVCLDDFETLDLEKVQKTSPWWWRRWCWCWGTHEEIISPFQSF